MQRSGGLLLILIGFSFLLMQPPPPHTGSSHPSTLLVRSIVDYRSQRFDEMISFSPGWSADGGAVCHCLLTPRWEMRIRHTCPTPDHTKTPNPTAPPRTPRPPPPASRTYRYIYWTTKPALCGFFFFFFFDKIVLLFKMETPQNFSSKCTNTKAGGLSSIAFMSLPLPSL